MQPRDSNSSGVTIRCKGGDAVGRMVTGACAFGEAAGLAPAAAGRLAIIVEELVTNLVEHGGVGEDGEIELSLALNGATVAIGLGDSGVAFDPRTASSADAIPERGGGAGLNLVRAWADIVDYRCREGWNRLDLRMRLDD